MFTVSINLCYIIYNISYMCNCHIVSFFITFVFLLDTNKLLAKNIKNQKQAEISQLSKKNAPKNVY